MKPRLGNLLFLVIALGIVLAGIAAIYANVTWVQRYHANNNKAIPEWRMPLATTCAFSFAIGILWFGWTGEDSSVHWNVPTIAGVFIGFGLVVIFIQLIVYIIDGYLMFAASAAAGNMMARSLFAAICPLFDRKLFQTLGVAWVNTLLRCVALILIPVPLLFYIYGPRIRQRSIWAPTPQVVPPAETVLLKDEL